MMKNALMLLVFVAISFVPAFLGASTAGPGEWYAQLRKPSFNPPSWIFGPVWTLLYAAMGTAAWLVWKRAGWHAAAPALLVFAAHLVLNGLWTWIFFGLHRPGWAFVEIVALWGMIVLTMAMFHRHSAAAMWLLAPYLAWVSFAAFLNFTLWKLNS